MTTDELAAAIAAYLQERYPGEVAEVASIRCASGRKVPVAIPAVHAPARRQEPEDEDKEDTEVAAAIMDLIHDSTTRLTGGQVKDRLADDDRRGFGRKNIDLTLTRLAKEERLTSHAKDPQDGHGRGYGLPEWDQA